MLLTKRRMATVFVVVMSMVVSGAGALVYGGLPAEPNELRLTQEAKAAAERLMGLAGQSGDPKKDQDKIQGTWEVIEFIADGTPVPDKIRSKLQVIFKDDKMQLTGLGGIDKREYVFKLDPTKKPKVIYAMPQFDPYKGQTLPAIYDIDGDKLKICMSNGVATEPPAEFNAPAGSKLALLVLKRAKS
jgi:uncharacterized protein (TIGR03067 family)